MTDLNYPMLPCKRDPDRWFADGTTREARQLIQSAINECRTCPALAACMEKAVKVKPTCGVWAGRCYNAPRPGRVAG